jgi:PAS domain-containing protein
MRGPSLQATKKTLWELFWDYDPNGLVALDASMRIQVVNPAFCRMFRVDAQAVIGISGASILGELDDYEEVLATGEPILEREKAYPHLDLYVHQVIFAVIGQNLVACINVDRSLTHSQRTERNRLKQETIDKVQQVVDNQMKVAQEIASLLGETTADTKASLLKLIRAIEVEM